MKNHTVQPVILAAIIAAATASSATAQDLAQILGGGSRDRHSAESTIVISVRDFSDRGDVCGNGFSFPRPGGALDSFDFPHSGRRMSPNEFPRSSRTLGNFAIGSLRYFQLPADSQTPDIVGCLDAQQNILFLTIKPHRQSLPTPPAPAPPATFPAPPPAPAPEPNGQTQLFQRNAGAQNFTPNAPTP